MKQFSFDPGLRLLGAAIWDQKSLMMATTVSTVDLPALRDATMWRWMAQRTGAFLAECSAIEERNRNWSHVYYERMQYYRDKNVKVDDLFQLVGTSGAVVALEDFRHAELKGFLPAEWTSRTAKEVNHRRIWKRLDRQEGSNLWRTLYQKGTRDEFAAKMLDGKFVGTKYEHAIDAVGIGLYGMKRL